MSRSQAFELLLFFKMAAKELSHLYDVYHGLEKVVHLWFIYEDETENSRAVASIRIEDIFEEEPYVIELMINGKSYQIIDFNVGKDLIKSIKY